VRVVPESMAMNTGDSLPGIGGADGLRRAAGLKPRPTRGAQQG
jgi:hypothetical protein